MKKIGTFVALGAALMVAGAATPETAEAQFKAAANLSYNESFRAQLVPAIKRLQLHDDPVSAANTVITVIDAIATHATIEPEYWTPTRQRKQLKFVLASVFES